MSVLYLRHILEKYIYMRFTWFMFDGIFTVKCVYVFFVCVFNYVIVVFWFLLLHETNKHVYCCVICFLVHYFVGKYGCWFNCWYVWVFV
jgi:hypothetical protein